MSDFIADLRREVLDGHAEQRRRTRRRPAWAPPRRAWRPAVSVALAGAAALLLVLALRPLLPPERSAAPHVTGVIPVGGTPGGGAFAGGSLWVSINGLADMARIDPVRRTVVSRMPVSDENEHPEVALGAVVPGTGDGPWFRYGRPDTVVARIDIDDERANVRFSAGPGRALAVGGGYVWAATPAGIERLDVATGELVERVPVRAADALAFTDAALWAASGDGTVSRVDFATMRVSGAWARLVPGRGHALVADAGGAWALGGGTLVRLDGGGVEWRVRVARDALPLLARTRSGLWAAAGDALGGGYRVVRLDPETGRRTASVGVGTHRPVALAGEGDRLAIVAADGTVVLIRA